LTKEKLKQLHNAPRRDEFFSEEQYVIQKQIWIDNNPSRYAEILEAPNEEE
jgi:hypothetical protein